jgi:hypothetical protein
MRRPTRVFVVGVLAGMLTAALGATAVWALASDDAEVADPAAVASVHTHTEDHDQGPGHDEEAGSGGGGAPSHDHGLVIHDSTGGREPTAEDEEHAQDFYEAVREGIAEYADLDVALVDGYVESPNSANQSIKHYMKAGVRGDALDPDAPSGLMYFVDENQATLLGAVWVTQQPDPPQPGGPLTVWHDHSSMGCPAAHPDCPAATGGEGAGNPPKMFHVWTWDGAVDHFAHDFVGTLGGSGPRGAEGPKPTLPFDV